MGRSAPETRRLIDIAMVKETKADGQTQQGFLSGKGGLRPNDREGIGRWQHHWQKRWFGYRGIDLTKEYIEVNAAFHCCNGGVRIEENGQTTLRVSTQSRGGDGPLRRGQIGRRDDDSSQVFGARAEDTRRQGEGDQNLDGSQERRVKASLDRVERLRTAGNQSPYLLRKELQKTAWKI